MRGDHLFCACLVFGLQWLLLAIGVDYSEKVVGIPLLVVALVIPVPGYMWALRDAQLGLKTSRRTVRNTIVGVVAFSLSCVGFILGLVLFAKRFRAK
jgi:hypothetical protein